MLGLFFVFSGIGAAVFYMFFVEDQMSPMVGASGAFSGVLAAYMVFFPNAIISYQPSRYTLFQQIHLRAIFYVPIWVGYNIISWWIGVKGIAWEAHIGGFIAGCIFAYFAKNNMPDARLLFLQTKLQQETPEINQ